MASSTYSPFFINLVAGGGAGVIETSLTYPLDLARTRVQLIKSSTTGTGSHSPTVVKVLSDVWRQEGVSAGLSTVVVASLAGGLTGATESVFHTPFEVVKVRLQSKEHAHLRNTWDCVKDIVTREGPLSLYRGFEAYLLRQVVWNGAFFGIIGLMRQAAAAQQEQQHKAAVGASSSSTTTSSSKMLEDFSTGLFAGSVATILNTPLDVAKTRLQVEANVSSREQPWSLQVVRHIYQQEGLRACFKGLNARLYRAAPGSGVLLLAHHQISEALSKQGRC